MSALVRSERHGEVIVIVIDNPPVNALAQPVREALLAAVLGADDDPTTKAIVIHGEGRNFIAGADIREFDAPPLPPLLNDVLLRLEACRKPVVAALHGSALGGGFELALASHYRCAIGAGQGGLPEVKLGLLPGAGGTQRLPRAVGVKQALDMMVSGEPLGFERLQALGLIDRMLEGDAKAAAIAYAEELIGRGAAPRRLREQPIPDAAASTAAFFAEYRKALPRAARRSGAVERIVRCVEAAVGEPFEQALARSRELFEQCRTSEESTGLRHLFFAERAAGRDARGGARPVQSVGVVGAGTMGAGIAISLATSGHDVVLVDTTEEALGRGLDRVRATIEASAAKGRLSAAEARAAIGRVQGATGLEALRPADLVIEAVFESMAVKQELFGKLDALCRPGAVLATNTSTLDIDAIAGATGRPEDVVGMHFFSPANVMRLVEVVRGAASSAEVIATAVAVSRRLGKIAVVVGNCFGFVGNRMLYCYGRENQLMLLEGAPPERIDAALEAWGMAMGPNAVGDLTGLDVGYRVRRERKDLPDDPRYYRVADLLVERGRYGQKTGRGIYRYEGEARRRTPDPEVAEMIAAEARRLGVAQRPIDDTEIVERCIYALVNEGARILEEGIAASPADIDVIWANGYGFPRARGGPMFYADRIGLATVLEAVRRFEREQGARYWTPAPLLERLAREGSTFTQWHARRAGGS